MTTVTAPMPKAMPKGYPFAPATKIPNFSSASQSSRPVTIPHIPELYRPIDQIIDELIPQRTDFEKARAEGDAKKSAPTVKEAAAALNPFAEALKGQNNPTKTSTGKGKGKTEGKSKAGDSINASHPFVDALKSTLNHTRTTNNAAAFKSTRSAVLDAFAGLSQATDPEDIPTLLEKSWESSPELTLRVIWNLRSIHEGKSAREHFYRAFAWLYKTHPRIALANLRYVVEPSVKRTIKRKKPEHDKALAEKPEDEAEDEDEDEEDMVFVTLEDAGVESKAGAPPSVEAKEEAAESFVIGLPHGYWKDLLNILLLASTDQLNPTSSFDCLCVQNARTSNKNAEALKRQKEWRRKRKPQDVRVSEAFAADKKASTEASEARYQKHRKWNNNIGFKLKKDKTYRALYAIVARLFADALARDMGILREISDRKIDSSRRLSLAHQLTLVGKWAPSVGGSHDRVTSIATPIAELLYAGGHLPLPEFAFAQPLSPDIAHKFRSAYARWALSPLRRFLQVPEVQMSARRWDKVKYTRVSSKCMQINKDNFYENDRGRFMEYLLDVARGGKRISGATILPHELLIEAIKANAGVEKKGSKGAKAVDVELDEMRVQVIEGQWKTMVERVKESGVLDNAIAVCDVSGSMGDLWPKAGPTTPIFPAVALTILLSELATPPWANTFITFAEHPEVVTFSSRSASLTAKAAHMMTMPAGLNTDFNAIFTELILPLATKHKIAPKDMVKRLFVFTDMQFDDSRTKGFKSKSKPKRWATEHQIIKKAFSKAGYDMPEIVYWNLAGDVAKPITKDEEGVALVSGFSPGMLKVFMEGEELNQESEVGTKPKPLDPVALMLKALDKESFSSLKVVG